MKPLRTKISVLLLSALLLHCPKEKKDDQILILTLLAVTNKGLSCEMTFNGTSVGEAPLTIVESGETKSVKVFIDGSQKVGFVQAKTFQSGKRLIFKGITKSLIFKQESCPIDVLKNMAVFNTDYNSSSGVDSQTYIINSNGNYLFYFTTDSTQDLTVERN